ncbi:MAG: type II toxin-antitoxin system Phd/YefM family antitoxin [Mycobacteriales bacterium]
MSAQVGIRDLQRHASSVISRVKAGEMIEITEHGRLVAVVSPPSVAETKREELIASGALTPGSGGLAGWAPLPARAEVPALSEVLNQLRDEDRS